MEKSINSFVHADYDSHGDALYVFCGKPYGTMNYQVDQDLTLRFDPRTRGLVGITLLHCSKVFHITKSPKAFEEYGLQFFGLLQKKALETSQRKFAVASHSAGGLRQRQIQQRVHAFFRSRELDKVLEKI